MRPGPLVVVGLVGVLLMGSSLVGASAEASSESRMWLSTDGVRWSHDLDQPLFDPSVRWVPGDARTASFLVRQEGAGSARIFMRPAGLSRSSHLATDVALSARLPDGDWVTLPVGGTTEVSGPALEDGAMTRVEVRAVFDSQSQNQTQQRRMRLRFHVEVAAVPGPGSASAGLGDTGTGVTLCLLGFAAVLLGAGCALVTPRRRTDESP